MFQKIRFMKLIIILATLIILIFSSNFRNEKVLSLTMDGYGDGCNATINYFDSKGKF